MDDHSLHNCELHGYETITATLKDGRTVQLEVNSDTGALEIIREQSESSAEPEETPSAIQQITNATGNMITFLPPPLRSGKFIPNDSTASNLSSPRPPADTMWAETTMKMSQEMARKRWEAGNSGYTDPDDGYTYLPIIGNKTKMPVDYGFKAALTSVMNDNKFDRRLRGQARGKLDMTRLYKSATGSTSVFAQKSLRRNRDYHVVLAVDESGSMNGNRINRAAHMTQFLATHLELIPGLELAVVGFSDVAVVHKAFGDNQPIDGLADVVQRSGGGGTAHLAALRKSYGLLNPSLSGRKILLYLTDGEAEIHIDKAMRTLIGGARDVMSIGVGINCDVDQFAQSIRVNNPNDMKTETLQILRRNIRRG